MNRAQAKRLNYYYLRQQGLALIELMIALVLGLVIIGAVTGIMLSNIQGFRTTRGLSQIQDGARVGYELLARDIRQAANVPCGNDIPVVNVLNSAQGDPDAVPWQYDFNNAFIGFSGTEALAEVSNQIAGTESIVTLSGDASDIYVTDYPLNNNGANFTVATASGNATGLIDGEVLLICNEDQASIFQLTSGGGGGGGNGNGNGNGNGGNASAGENIVVNTGGTHQPGNCSKGLGPVQAGQGGNLCDVNGSPGPFDKNAVIAKLSSSAWYIGDNGRAGEGGRSLYSARLGLNGTQVVLDEIEIAAGVTDMSLRYRLTDSADFIDAGTVGNRWADVNAVEITLEMLSQERNISTDSSVDEGRLGRGFTSIVAIRNRSQ